MNTFEIIRLIGDAPADFLTHTETSLLTRMACFADKQGKNIKPGIEELIRQTKFSKRTILKTLKELIKKNVLIIGTPRNRGDHEPSCYEFNIKILQDKRLPATEYYKILKNKLSISSAPDAPLVVQNLHQLSSAPDALLDSNISDQVVQNLHQSSAESALLVVQNLHSHLIQPHINLIPPSNIVELGANSTPPLSSKKSKKNWGKETQEIFGHWQKVLNHSRSKLDQNRRSKILKALESGYSVEDLKKAIEGVKNTPWNMRENPSGELYDDIPLIFRNSSQIERFIRNFDTPLTPKKENGATALKTGFLERARDQSKVLDAIAEELRLKVFKKETVNELK